MKNKLRLCTFVAAAIFTAQAPAQSTPRTPASPSTPATPAAPPTPATPATPATSKREPVTFLGVVAVPAPTALVEQLGLPAGFGLLVESVVPESPAAAAGIKQYDLLKTFGDQKLVSAGQLAALVRSSSDGADVSFTLLRKGQESKVTAKLVKRVPEGGAGRYIRDIMGLPGMPKGFNFMTGPDGKRITIRRGGEDGNAHTTTLEMNRARVIIRDDKGEIEVSGEPGARSITARKPDGTVVFTGPINTDEERKTVPADLLEKLQKIDRDRPTKTDRTDKPDKDDKKVGSRRQIEEDARRQAGEDLDFSFDFDFDEGGENMPAFAPVPPIPAMPPMPPAPPMPSSGRTI